MGNTDCSGDMRNNPTPERIAEMMPQIRASMERAGLVLDDEHGQETHIKVEQYKDGYGGWTYCGLVPTVCHITVAPTIYRPLECVLMHEMGHAMGLKHNPSPVDDVMDSWGVWFESVDDMSKQLAKHCADNGCAPLKIIIEAP